MTLEIGKVMTGCSQHPVSDARMHMRPSCIPLIHRSSLVTRGTLQREHHNNAPSSLAVFPVDFSMRNSSLDALTQSLPTVRNGPQVPRAFLDGIQGRTTAYARDRSPDLADVSVFGPEDGDAGGRCISHYL